MPEVVPLRPAALADLESVRTYMGSVDGVDDGLLAQFANEATGVIERYTSRRLRARPYTNAFSLSCTTVDKSPALSSAAAFANVRRGMFVSGVNIQAGTFVQAITDASNLTMSLPAAGAGAASRAFTGSPPLVLDGNDADELLLPELPLKELISAKSRSETGALTTLNISGYRGVGRAVLVLPNAVFPESRLNIELECVVGYDETDEALQDLELACRRLVQVMFLDHKDRIGRGNQVTVQGIAVSFIDRELPADIKGLIDRYGRMY